MNEPVLTITKRHLPHWTLKGATYFVTFRVAKGQLNSVEQRIVFDHVLNGDNHFYRLIACTVMPDHLHLILRPATDYSLSRVMRGIKGVSAYKINRLSGTRDDAVWQRESFDRILRDQDELIEKLNYMLCNPLKQGLVDDPWKYQHWYFEGAGSGKNA
ncbi:MAG: transposase [candidate division Zixibacteria bacterium]|nr:transposase [candidate division Zixibacteria bacterium]